MSGIVQREELFAEPLGVSRLNSGFRTHFKELLDTLMPEALDHTLERIVSLYSVSIKIRASMIIARLNLRFWSGLAAQRILSPS